MTKREVPKPTKNLINSGIMLSSNTIEEARAEILWGLFSWFMLVCTGKERNSFFWLTGGGRVVVVFWGLVFFTCSIVQKMWASSCWKRLTRVKPLKVPESSFRWRTPKSASLRGISLQDRGRWANIKLEGTCKNLPFILLIEYLRQHRN